MFRPRARQSGAALVPPGNGPSGLTAGWKPFPGTQSPHQQIGAFNGQMLNQYPVNIPGVQLHCGVESMRSHWQTPHVCNAQAQSLDTQKTQRPGNVFGGMRYGSLFSGPIGPVNAQSMTANVAAAQVRQSGLAAMSWARGLSTQ